MDCIDNAVDNLPLSARSIVFINFSFSVLYRAGGIFTLKQKLTFYLNCKKTAYYLLILPSHTDCNHPHKDFEMDILQRWASVIMDPANFQSCYNYRTAEIYRKSLSKFFLTHYDDWQSSDNALLFCIIFIPTFNTSRVHYCFLGNCR